jgi:molybdenum cofactor cytidylyltransferase
MLAAGPSSRLGEPKQLLRVEGISLLEHTVRQSLNAHCSPELLIWGAHRERLRELVERLPIPNLHNPAWAEGISSSIRLGLRALLRKSPPDGVFLLVCDQPFISGPLLTEMRHRWEHTGQRIVACSYAGTLGTPVLFGKAYYPELLELKGQAGPRSLLSLHREDISELPFPGGEIDIDTWKDYESLPLKYRTFMT